jgi:chromosomal replication initiation ATPase DnaA
MEQINYELNEEFEKKIITEFARLLGVTPTQIIAKNRCQHITDVRHLYCKLRCEMHGVNYSLTGREIGRTYRTVERGINRINGLLYINDPIVVPMWNMVKNNPLLYVGELCW